MLLVLAALAYAAPSVDTPVHSGELASPDAAVAIAIEDYRFLPDQAFAVRDATAFADTLIATRGVPDGNVRRVIGPSANGIRQAIGDASKKVGRDGTLWIYFAGRCAVVGEEGRRVLLDDEAPRYERELASNAVGLDELPTLLGEGRAARVLLVLECDFDRNASPIAFASKPPKGWPWPDLSDAHVATLAATTGNGPAQGVAEAEHGLFTYTLLQGMRGWADGGARQKQKDGRVTLAELADWAADQMRGKGQAPQVELPSEAAEWELLSGRLEASAESSSD